MSAKAGGGPKVVEEVEAVAEDVQRADQVCHLVATVWVARRLPVWVKTVKLKAVVVGSVLSVLVVLVVRALDVPWLEEYRRIPEGVNHHGRKPPPPPKDMSASPFAFVFDMMAN